MTDRRMDRRIRELAADYNRPPDTPREEIWVGLEKRLTAVEPGGGRPDLPAVHRLERPAGRTGSGAPWFAWASAAAAVLVLGIGIGRLTAPGAGPASPARRGPEASVSGGVGQGPAAVAPESGGESPVHSAAVRHLGRSESFLSLVQADAGEGRVDPAVGRWARGLLLETRLLLDAPVSSDPELGRLLEDLELILAQVVVLEAGDGSRGREELRLIADGLRERDVLTRIRTVLSESGPAIL